MSELPNGRALPVEVILIHGTLPPWQWAKRVESEEDVHELFPWTDPNLEGSLASAIRSLNQDGFDVSFSVLPWRGQNTAAAREEGARALTEALARRSERETILVAHSHGGNVAIRAMQKAGSPRSVRGVVCLATPFLQLLPRDPGGTLWLRAIGLLSLRVAQGFVALAALGLILVGTVGAIYVFRGEPIEGLTLGLGGLFTGAGALTLFLLPWLNRRLGILSDADAEAHTLKRQREALADHGTPVLAPCLTVHAAGDEAGAWLRLTSIVSGLSSGLRHRLVATLGVSSLVVAAFAIFGLAWSATDGEDLAMKVVLSAALWVGLSAGAYFLFTLFALTLSWAFEALPITFGWRGRGWHLTQTAVSLTPLYARNSEFIARPGSALLRHSNYKSAVVQSDVVEWIRRRLESS